MSTSVLIAVLARAFLGGEQTVEQVRERCAQTLGRNWRWLSPLAKSYVAAFDGKTRPSLRQVIRFLREDESFARLRRHRLTIARWLSEPQRMLPVAAAENWDLPPILSAGDLAAWLELTPGELDWFADLKGLTTRSDTPEALHHYRVRVLEKGAGGLRVIEAPKARMKELQRRILKGIVAAIPPHDAAHGFRTGRSIKTFVAPHAGQRVVLRMDLHDFFPSISFARVGALFRTAGYPDSVAALLAGLSTTTSSFLNERRHLPQGAPTSPGIANLCAYRCDCRLSGLARAAGAQYTRYADDLAFSGGEEFDRRVERFATHVAVVLHEEGFAVHHRKTRIMRRGIRQHLAGLVTNQKPNIIRSDYDLLKAILTNCVREGPASQNREAHADFRAHLAGRIGFVAMINPSRAQRLRSIFEQINWL